ncbi:conjugal transfer protein TraP [Klebsiella aerogenes]|uniref:conjugal transfer protein TraP n=1 Tax=Klebsiella aerogenes TaxID=548 RepID=UPI0032DB751E
MRPQQPGTERVVRNAIVCSLIWVIRVFHHLVLVPAGMQLLTLVLVFWLSGNTPGTVIAREVTTATGQKAGRALWLPTRAGSLVSMLYPKPVGELTLYLREADYAKDLDQAWRAGLTGLWVAVAALSVMGGVLRRRYFHRGEGLTLSATVNAGPAADGSTQEDASS